MLLFSFETADKNRPCHYATDRIDKTADAFFPKVLTLLSYKSNLKFHYYPSPNLRKTTILRAFPTTLCCLKRMTIHLASQHLSS